MVYNGVYGVVMREYTHAGVMIVYGGDDGV